MSTVPAKRDVMRRRMTSVPFGSAILRDQQLFAQAQQTAKMLANAVGTTPGFLLGKPDACFAVIVAAENWALDPWFVMRNVYQPKAGGNIAYMGKLIMAVCMSSGFFEDLPRPEYQGPWDAIEGNFEIIRGPNGEFTKPKWRPDHDNVKQCKVLLHYKLFDRDPEVYTFGLGQAFPLNSTLWATDPKTQVLYLATRRMVDSRYPAILGGGAPQFDFDPSINMIDVTQPVPAITDDTAALRMADFVASQRPAEPAAAVIDPVVANHAEPPLERVSDEPPRHSDEPAPKPVAPGRPSGTVNPDGSYSLAVPGVKELAHCANSVDARDMVDKLLAEKSSNRAWLAQFERLNMDLLKNLLADFR